MPEISLESTVRRASQCAWELDMCGEEAGIEGGVPLCWGCLAKIGIEA